MTHAEWQPLYSLYETNDDLQAIVELSGFPKGKPKVKVVEQATIIEGQRNDFKETLTNVAVH